jgi:hypothetical protein
VAVSPVPSYRRSEDKGQIELAKYWTHPDLGRFKNNWNLAWEKTFQEPAFKAFRNGSSSFTLSFDESPDPPSKSAVAVAKKFLKHAPKLVPIVVQALWDDFNGVGPSSGMWWEDGMVIENGALPFHVAEVNDGHVPQSAKELYCLLGLRQIQIRAIPRSPNPRLPLAVFEFVAPFEDEHGIGIITDCAKVLGLGYASDCGFYRGEKKTRK